MTVRPGRSSRYRRSDQGRVMPILSAIGSPSAAGATAPSISPAGSSPSSATRPISWARSV